MKNFFLRNNLVQIVNDNGTVSTVYFNQNSGKVYYRYKIKTISNVKHPGIYLGYDSWGNHYFMHNHQHVGKPSIEFALNFEKAQPIYPADNHHINPPLVIIKKALNSILRGEPYDSIQFNCQSFINEVCNNHRRSEAVEDWGKRLGVGLGTLGIVLLIMGLSGE